jgi:Family of unknown function (DUF6152)
MKTKLTVISLAAVALLAVAVPLFAHHGAAVYDTSKMVTVKGTVTQWVWANPHCFLKVDAKTDSGDTAHWIIESAGTASVANQGWSKTMFKPGDEAVVDVTPYKIQSGAVLLGRFAGHVVINGRVFGGGFGGAAPARSPN